MAPSAMAPLRLALALAMVQAAYGNFKVEVSSLKVEQPPEVKGKYDMALANFGVPLYGGSLKGIITFPAVNSFGCEEFPADFRLPKLPGFASILLLDRGGPDGHKCKFTTKAYYAQKVGASALIVVSDQESLTTMDASSDDESREIAGNITIPTGLVKKSVGDRLKGGKDDAPVIATLDWTDSLPHPDDRVEWEFWTNSNDACGVKCDQQKRFVREFASTAQALEKGGYTQFTPHYVTWLCPKTYRQTRECQSQCINHGRYCAPDPDDDLNKGYDGKDVVVENLRELCFFKQANESSTPWLYWDYVTMFGTRCSMESGHYNQECAENVYLSLGGNNFEGGLQAWRACVGDVEADATNELLESEQANQQGSEKNGHTDISIVPTVLINLAQYRGKLQKNAVLKALCAGFSVDTEPEVCIGEDVSENECEEGNIGDTACKANTRTGKTRCINTFRGYECGCVSGFIEDDRGDGVKYCVANNECKRAALTLDRCTGPRSACRSMAGSDPPFSCDDIEDACAGPSNGGGWSATLDGKRFSACKDTLEHTREAYARGDDISAMANYTCECPSGFEHTNVRGSLFDCKDINECEYECKGSNEICVNLPGNFTCTCSNGVHVNGKCVVDSAHVDEVVSKKASGASIGAVIFIILGVVATLGIMAYGLYKYRLQSYMRSEVRSIMAQYMPLEDNEDLGPA